MFKHLKGKLIGNIGIGLISGLTALSFAGVGIQMGFSGFKARAEKQLHILNGIRFATIIQIGIDEGWVTPPETNNVTTIQINELDELYEFSINLKNPSLNTQEYNETSAIIIENTNGKLNFYCNLIEDGSDHQYTDPNIVVFSLTIDDIYLNIN
ncbi:MAG: hypothetical protein ACON35_05560 [Candidatus Marinamargulisbacteria bacterium]